MLKIITILLQVIGVGAGAYLGISMKSSPSSDDTQIEADGEDHDGEHGDDAKGDHGDDNKKAKKDKKKKKKKKKKGDADDHGDDSGEYGEEDNSNYGYVKFSRQFIVPVIKSSGVKSLLVLDLNLEVAPSETERAYSREPKVRDALLNALLRLSNEGSFEDQMLTERNLQRIREELRIAAEPALGAEINQVLILSMARQDM